MKLAIVDDEIGKIVEGTLVWLLIYINIPLMHSPLPPILRYIYVIVWSLLPFSV